MSLLCLCPVPHLAAQAQRAPVPVALIVLHLRHHLRAAHSRLRMLQAQRQAVQPVHHGLHHQNCLRWSALSTACSQVTRDRQGHPVMRSQMGNLRDQQQCIAILKQVASQQQNQTRLVSVPPAANVPLPPYPRRHPSDKGFKKLVQAENANAVHKSSDSETDRLQDIQEEPRRRIGPSHVKELAKFFTCTSDEEENSQVNNRTRCKKLFEPKKEEESEK